MLSYKRRGGTDAITDVIFSGQSVHLLAKLCQVANLNCLYMELNIVTVGYPFIGCPPCSRTHQVCKVIFFYFCRPLLLSSTKSQNLKLRSKHPRPWKQPQTVEVAQLVNRLKLLRPASYWRKLNFCGLVRTAQICVWKSARWSGKIEKILCMMAF